MQEASVKQAAIYVKANKRKFPGSTAPEIQMSQSENLCKQMGLEVTVHYRRPRPGTGLPGLPGVSRRGPAGPGHPVRRILPPLPPGDHRHRQRRVAARGPAPLPALR